MYFCMRFVVWYRRTYNGNTAKCIHQRKSEIFSRGIFLAILVQFEAYSCGRPRSHSVLRHISNLFAIYCYYIFYCDCVEVWIDFLTLLLFTCSALTNLVQTCPPLSQNK